MRNYLPALALLYIPGALHSQNIEVPCGNEAPSPEWENRFQQLVTDQRNEESSAVTSYVIPVIFHVIHGGEPVGTFPNIPQGQINSQITVLNEDFAATGYNASTYPPNAFMNWVANQSLPVTSLDSTGRLKIADMNIQFCLAEYDTNGNLLAEPGIERIDYTTFGWPNPNIYNSTTTMKAFLDSAVKPQTIWDPVKYLNIWITDRNSAIMFTGVSTMPPLTGLPGITSAGEGTDSTDGIWCYAGVVGSPVIYPSGIYTSSNVRGRTITHEVGHYVGLRHIWGDAPCATDYCNDTPPAAAQNTGNPSFPFNVGSCNSPSNSPDGEMFMNFMDYSGDPYKYMFTPDQAARAQVAMTNSPMRNQLGTHGLCSTTSVEEENTDASSISIYPNPAVNAITLSGVISNNVNVKIFSLTGELVLETSETTISTSELSAGTYIIWIETGSRTEVQRFVHL